MNIKWNAPQSDRLRLPGSESATS